MTDRFPLTISYAQIAVFDPDLEIPFNDWNDRQYTQGFSCAKVVFPLLCQTVMLFLLKCLRKTRPVTFPGNLSV
ncbi:Competence protein J (ComJ) [Phyllobacterium sp. OV277]|nr:Competence protein J (ComJ) [Phyllobacterium sp. OV277]